MESTQEAIYKLKASIEQQKNLVRDLKSSEKDVEIVITNIEDLNEQMSDLVNELGKLIK